MNYDTFKKITILAAVVLFAASSPAQAAWFTWLKTKMPALLFTKQQFPATSNFSTSERRTLLKEVSQNPVQKTGKCTPTGAHFPKINKFENLRNQSTPKQTSEPVVQKEEKSEKAVTPSIHNNKTVSNQPSVLLDGKPLPFTTQEEVQGFLENTDLSEATVDYPDFGVSLILTKKDDGDLIAVIKKNDSSKTPIKATPEQRNAFINQLQQFLRVKSLMVIGESTRMQNPVPMATSSPRSTENPKNDTNKKQISVKSALNTVIAPFLENKKTVLQLNADIDAYMSQHTISDIDIPLTMPKKYKGPRSSALHLAISGNFARLLDAQNMRMFQQRRQDKSFAELLQMLTIKCLLVWGANVHQKDPVLGLPLAHATRTKRDNIRDLLIKYGATSEENNKAPAEEPKG